MSQHEGGKLAKGKIGKRCEVLRLHKVLNKQFWTVRVCNNEACMVLTGVPACHRPLNWKKDAWFQEYRSAVEKVVREVQAKSKGKKKPRVVTIQMKTKSGDANHEMRVESNATRLSIEATIENISFVASHLGN